MIYFCLGIKIKDLNFLDFLQNINQDNITAAPHFPLLTASETI
jgi:hypothetical protein